MSGDLVLRGALHVLPLLRSVAAFVLDPQATGSGIALVVMFLLGPLIVAGVQAAIVAYATALGVVALLVASAPVLVVVASVAPRPDSHWFARPAAFGAVLGLALFGAGALTLRLAFDGADIHWLRPLLPLALALPVDLVCLGVLAVRGARAARGAVSGQADARAAGKSLGLVLLHAVSRGVAAVVFAAALAFLAVVCWVAAAGESFDGGLVVTGAIVTFPVCGLGALFAWLGRRRRAAPTG